MQNHLKYRFYPGCDQKVAPASEVRLPTSIKAVRMFGSSVEAFYSGDSNLQAADIKANLNIRDQSGLTARIPHGAHTVSRTEREAPVPTWFSFLCVRFVPVRFP